MALHLHRSPAAVSLSLSCRPSPPPAVFASPSTRTAPITASLRCPPRWAGAVRFSTSASRWSSAAAACPPPSPAPPFLFLVGGPCAGKGTQSRLLVEEFGGPVRGPSDGS